MSQSALDDSTALSRLNQLYPWDEKTREHWQGKGPSIPMDDILVQLVNQVAKSLNADRAFIIEFDEAWQPLPLRVEYTKDESIKSFKGALPPWNSCPFLRRTSQKLLTYADDVLETEDLKNDPEWHCNFRELGVRGFIACPIFYNHTIFCVLVLHTEAPRQWQPAELALVQVASSQGATSLYQAKLALVQETYQLVLDGTNDGVWEWDLRSDKLYLNQRFMEILGADIPEQERTRDRIREYFHPEDTERVQEALANHFKSGDRYEMEHRIIRPTGEIRYVISRGKAIRDSEGKPIRMAGLFTDITDHRHSMAQLIESNQRFQTIADASPTLIWTLSPQGQVTYANKTLFDFTGATPESIAQTGWVPYVHPDDYPLASRAIGAAIQEKTRFQTEFRMKQSTGEYRWVLATGAPILSPEEEVLSFVGSIVDIHEQKEAHAELAHYAQRLEEANRELEQFASMVSHDLQNPLRKLHFFSEMLTTMVTPEGLETLARIQAKVTKMQTLIADLLSLSRINRKGKPFRKVHLNDVVTAALDDFEVMIKETGAKVTVAPLIVVEADTGQLQQVFQNLISNSIKFHKPDAKPVITIQGAQIDDNSYRVTVEDNGIGFQQEYLEKIFEPFERLHGDSEYPGTGLGLAIVKKIVHRHRGSVSADNREGGGSRFCITLPIVQPEEDE